MLHFSAVFAPVLRPEIAAGLRKLLSNVRELRSDWRSIRHQHINQVQTTRDAINTVSDNIRVSVALCLRIL